MSEIVKFNYLHRDSGNWKKFGCKRFSNPEKLPLQEIETKIRQNLIDGMYFYPEKVGIKKFKFQRFCDDYSWYEFESVEVAENIKNKEHLSSISKFCSLLERMNPSDIFLMGDQPTTCPMCGTRTEICNESNLLQLHLCLNDKCNFEFLVENHKLH